MALIVSGTSPYTAADVDGTTRALDCVVLPPQACSESCVAVQTGATTAIAANGTIFALRWTQIDSVMLVRKIVVWMMATVGFTAAQQIGVHVAQATKYTTFATGGAVVLGDQTDFRQRNTSLADIRVSTTAALTLGTATLS